MMYLLGSPSEKPRKVVLNALKKAFPFDIPTKWRLIYDDEEDAWYTMVKSSNGCVLLIVVNFRKDAWVVEVFKKHKRIVVFKNGRWRREKVK